MINIGFRVQGPNQRLVVDKDALRAGNDSLLDLNA